MKTQHLYLILTILFFSSISLWSKDDIAVFPVKEAIEKTEVRKGKKEKKTKKRGNLKERILTKMLFKKIERRMKQFEAYADSTKCDTLMLFSGRQIPARIVEINKENIKYRKCNSAKDAQTITIRNVVVEAIHYANGKVSSLKELGVFVEVPDEAPNEIEEYEWEESERSDEFSQQNPFLMGLLFGGLLGLLGLIIAMIVYKGRDKGKIVLGCLVGQLAMLAIVFMFLLVAFGL